MITTLIRLASVLALMLIVGLIWYRVQLSRIVRTGVEASKAKPAAALQAKKAAQIGAFLFMVAMVSVAGLFM